MYSVEIVDDADEFLKFYSEKFPDLIRKAAKSAGYFIQKQIKEGIKSGAPGGEKYKNLFPEPFRSRLDGFANGDKKPLGNLVNAISYTVKKNKGIMNISIGWKSPTAERYGLIQEKGLLRPFTARLRSEFIQAGLHPKIDKENVIIPARPTYGPMFKVLEPQISPYMKKKIDQYLFTENKKKRTGKKYKIGR